MLSPLDHWRITHDATNDEAYAILAQEPVWNSFALADLEPPLRDYSQFAIASQEKSDERSICLILRHPIIGEVLSPFGSAEGITAILKHIPIPEHPLIQVQEFHFPLLKRYYRPETTWKGILRMAVTSDSFQPLRSLAHRPITRLTVSDVPALETLYAHYLENHFSAGLCKEGLYFGAHAGGNIIAAGGTHALVPKHSIAVLGNIITAPEFRGQGYATAITAALVETLFKQQITLVVLNVFEDNNTAIRVYERLGFQTYHRFFTGKASRLDKPL
jgi:ribosomal protein S18 acetylase RimI-like enzyme